MLSSRLSVDTDIDVLNLSSLSSSLVISDSKSSQILQSPVSSHLRGKPLIFKVFFGVLLISLILGGVYLLSRGRAENNQDEKKQQQDEKKKQQEEEEAKKKQQQEEDEKKKQQEEEEAKKKQEEAKKKQQEESTSKREDPEAEIRAKIIPVTDRYGNKYTILGKYKRFHAFYVEGFSVQGSHFLESAGNYGDSEIHYMTLDEDKMQVNIEKRTTISSQYFSEGIDILQNKDGTKSIYMLTYKKRKILKFDTELNLISEDTPMPSPIYEGWGMTHDPLDPTTAIISDGSSYLYYLDVTKSFSIKRKLRVFDKKGNQLDSLNELEFVNGFIWANVFMTDWIVKIDPNTGKVIKSFDMTYISQECRKDSLKILGRNLAYDDLLNGIAYDHKEKTFYITGKKYPYIYKVSFDED